jgi:glycerol-3-phosphate acyltransferase PlsY
MVESGLAILIAYFAGSVPTAYLVGRAKGIDLKTVGSGNYGATNVFRNLGTGPAVVVLIVDVAKGYLPVALLPNWLAVHGMPAIALQLAIAVAAVLGHVFSVFLRFRGGKGIGTAGGAYLAMTPAATGIAALAWLTVVLWKRVVSLASLAAAISLLAGVIWFHVGDWPASGPLIVVTALLAAFVFWTHRENITRLRRGEEERIAPPEHPEVEA